MNTTAAPKQAVRAGGRNKRSASLAQAFSEPVSIFPGHEIPVQPPANLRESDRQTLGLHGTSKLQPTSVSVLNDVVAMGRGPLKWQGEYRKESFVIANGREEFIRRKKHWREKLESCVGARSRIKSPALWITDDWSCGYFHWTCDTLPRILLANRITPLEELTLLLPAKSRRFPFIAQSLEAFPQLKVRVLDRFERVHCDTLVLPSQIRTSGNYHPVLMSELHQTLWSFAGNGQQQPSTPPSRRIFLSRRDANRRRLINEDDLSSIIHHHGYELVVAEHLSWREQIQLFSETSHFASIHGAGLSNMLAMPSGGRILEIRGDEGYTPNCYLSLASVRKQEYFYAFCQRSDPSQSVHHGHVQLDPATLDRTLDQMAAPRQI